MINYYEKKIKTVMVDNSTNINKANNHLLPQIRPLHMTLEIQGLAWNWYKNVAE